MEEFQTLLRRFFGDGIEIAVGFVDAANPKFTFFE
jgi:hypothetical protein